jgi:hypothetical protein
MNVELGGSGKGSAIVSIAGRCVSRRPSGQKCVWRDARHCAREALFAHFKGEITAYSLMVTLSNAW